MSNTNDIRTGKHCTFNIHVHLVFVTKYRKKVFTKNILDFLTQVFEDVACDFEATIKEFDDEKGHVHLFIHYPSKTAVLKLTNSLKEVSSRYLRTRFPELKKNDWQNALWSLSDAARQLWWGSFRYHQNVYSLSRDA